MQDPKRDQEERAVREIVRTWTDAERDADANTLQRLLHETFRGIGFAGFVLNRDQWLERYRGGHLEHRAFALEDEDLRTYGASALLVAVLEQETSYQGHDSSGRFRLSMTLVDNGGWTIAGMHIGPLQAPGGPPSGAGGGGKA